MTPPPAFVAAPPSRPARRYALALLVAVYTCNFVDRSLVGIVGQPMKQELGLSDTQLGLLGGLAFALFYTILGVPIARVAERRERVGLIALALALWSVMTALCGLAQGYPQLLLARMGVGVGEAGCSPAAQSLIADYYPPERRATALSIYALGIPIGALVSAVAGGAIAGALGWRAAFIAIGLPGMLLALIVRLTLREPVRGLFEGVRQADAPPALSAVAHRLAQDAVFRNLALGAALASFSGYAVTTFAVPFLMRAFDLPIARAATGYGLLSGVAMLIGTGGGGWLADRLATRDARWRGWVPALGVLVAAPLGILALAQTSAVPLGALAFVQMIAAYLYFGPVFGLVSNRVPSDMRATAVAILFLVINLIGLGLGPLVAGRISDAVAAQTFSGDYALCAKAPGPLPPPCPAAATTGLRVALSAIMAGYGWAAIHFALAARALRQDARPLD